jgi:hypothetical protein
MRTAPSAPCTWARQLARASLVALPAALLLALSPVPITFGPNIQISGDQSYAKRIDQQEPSVVANPRNPAHAVTGFHDQYPTIQDATCRTAVTFDGGATWTLGGIVPRISAGDVCADPSLAADLDGNFYFGYLNYEGPDFRIAVAKSTDGGLTFPTATLPFQEMEAGRAADKPYVAVDSGIRSRFEGAVYVAYTHFDQATNPQGQTVDRSQIHVQVSVDGGATWAAPRTISRFALYPEQVNFAVPAVAPDGTVYVFWKDGDPISPPTRLTFSKSTDRGATWSVPADVISDIPNPSGFALRTSRSRSGFGLYTGTWPTPAVAADGTVYVAWADISSGSCKLSGSSFPPCSNSDIRMSVSRDAGATWSAPTRLHDDVGTADQFFPWISAHPDGTVSAFWLDRRLDPNNVNYDAFYTNTGDGMTFLPNVRVSTATSSMCRNCFIGDYNNLAATSDGVYAVWGDLRTGSNVRIVAARGTFGP